MRDLTEEAAIRTTCAYCGVGCGLVARPDGAGGVALAGDTAHPANRGRLCSKGAALGETLGLEDRLLFPEIGGQRVDWDHALSHVAQRFAATIAAHGPDSVAFYVSGQMLTEDYYVANKLMKGFIGTANIDTNSRLCMSSSVAGHRRAFGTDTVPGGYADLEEADLVVLVGSNLAWCHPVLFQRLQAARAAGRGPKLVVIDPRRTATAEGADLHLPLAPGGDVALFNALLTRIARRGAVDHAFVAAHVSGLEAALAAAEAGAGAETGLAPELLERFCDLWIDTERVVTVYSQGVNQSTSGTDKVNAILNCHLATGRIGKPGMGPFSVTGQPNAMGGREVGGLANMLVCHLDLEDETHRAAVQGFWGSPRIAAAPGLKAVDLFRGVEAGKIRALWIIGTNPAVSMPEADRVRAAIAGCDFTVVSEVTGQSDTARLADVLLPARAWGEKDGTVTNSERMISRQRAFLPPPGATQPDWWILAEVGRRMGWDAAFAFDGPAAVFREHAALSGIAGAFGKDFDISALAAISDADYAAMAPVQWPVSATRSGGRFFGDGRFFTLDGRGRMLPLVARGPVAGVDGAHPFRLNTGRLRDQWHTMTRTGKSPRLAPHAVEPCVEIHPADARALGLVEGQLARLENAAGQAVLRVQLSPGQRRGEVFTPMHWTGETGPTGRIDALVAGAVDPVSGQPESKAAAIALRPFAAGWYGFAVSRAPAQPDCAYWARARLAKGWRYELAGEAAPADWIAYARALFALDPTETEAEAVTVLDPARGIARVALIAGGRVQAALFVAPEPLDLARGYLGGLLGQPSEAGLMAGRPGAGRPDPGPTICACFDVGATTILRAIASQGLTSVEAIGAALKAGTNCGSCRPELAALLAAAAKPEAAE